MAGQTNKLAPASVNSLSEGVRFDPSEVYGLLSQYGVLPKWIQTRPISGDSAEYTPGANVIVAPKITNTNNKATLTHEMTHASQNLMRHAVQFLMNRKKEGEEITPVEQQFIDNYKKMLGEYVGTIGQMTHDDTTLYGKAKAIATALYPKTKNELTEQYYNYRTSPSEAMAFGVGNTSRPAKDPNFNAPPHLDPTFATMYSLLADNFSRLPNSTRLAAAKATREAALNFNTEKLIPEAQHDFPLLDYPNPFK